MSMYDDMINKRAMETWSGYIDTAGRQLKTPVTIYNFEEWKAHWLKTAEDWQARCEDEGLKETANHIASIIRANR